MREEMIEGLNSDKVKLEQQVAELKELLAQKETQAKRGKRKKAKSCRIKPRICGESMNERTLVDVYF